MHTMTRPAPHPPTALLTPRAPLHLAVLGASGRSGRHLVEQALAAGHAVRVLVRDPQKLGPLAGRVAVVQGDATDPTALAALVANTDAVLSVLGAVKGSPDNLFTRSTRGLVGAMQASGVSRLIVLGGAGVRVSQDPRTLGGRLAALATSLMIPRQVRDAHEQLSMLETSDLDWTVVRAPQLTEGPATGQFRVGYLPRPALARISRADVAAALLSQLADLRWRRQAPVVLA
ncbi:NAD(P)-dependent oxidoreductase [Deinococcus aestuarii]|uniref:NAD(P)-dependent oxidoreductase n=1 Tax=Deinococcus aestuarii TaxID=2774531 RepID=UPI001C0CEDE8|nr:NAD(P)H-binding protein [Deinococcus aestuarii]